jgi:hypothetical protein
LGRDNINKLTEMSIFTLISGSINPEQMAEILGQENIKKLTDEVIDDCIINAIKPEQVRSVLQKYGRI